MISLLITFLIVVLVAYLVWYAICIFIEDAKAKKLIGIIIGLIVLLYALQLFGSRLPVWR